MSAFWIGFLLGAPLWVPVGFLFAALMWMAREPDRQQECEARTPLRLVGRHQADVITNLLKQAELK